MTVLLRAAAARSCPVKTLHAFDPTVSPAPVAPDEARAERLRAASEFRGHILNLLRRSAGSVTDLSGLAESPDRSAISCREAMLAGIDVILGGWLPADVEGHRIGHPDLLVRGADRPDGSHRYHPVDVRWHRVVEVRKAQPDEPNPCLRYSALSDPVPQHSQELTGHGFRLTAREADLLSLAHYTRMLQAAGFADETSLLAAVVGTDDVFGEPVLVWVDLAAEVLRTFSRTHPDGWRLRSVLDRYDYAHAFRVELASAASGGGGSIHALALQPVVSAECRHCVWWAHCRSKLDEDDLSLRIDKGPLDRREITTLRRRGIRTVAELAGADLEEVLGWYLPEVAHRSGAEGRLRAAARRAGMLLADISLDRETSGPISVPQAEVEIDLDIETTADQRVYLWGFCVNDVAAGTSEYRHFSAFRAMDAEVEQQLAVEAMTWLRRQVEGTRSALVYHYSAFEVAAISRIAQQSADPVLQWAQAYAAASFVDLWEIIRSNFFGVAGLGLKTVAQRGAGFTWRDEEPDGLSSQVWFHSAVTGDSEPVRTAALRRVLEYNEDDVRATAAVRSWLRAQ